MSPPVAQFTPIVHDIGRTVSLPRHLFATRLSE
jgi:hypothetical protein